MISISAARCFYQIDKARDSLVLLVLLSRTQIREKDQTAPTAKHSQAKEWSCPRYHPRIGDKYLVRNDLDLASVRRYNTAQEG